MREHGSEEYQFNNGGTFVTKSAIKPEFINTPISSIAVFGD
jgi:hypothetical protein